MFSLSAWFPTQPVVGRVTDSSLRLRKRIGYRNDFQSYIYATIRPEAKGTVISGNIGMHRFAIVFMCVWLGFSVLMCGTLLIPSVRSLIAHPDKIQEETWMGIVVPLVLPLFGVGLVWFCRFLARNEDRFLAEFLIQTLDAKKCALINEYSTRSQWS